MNSKQPPDNKKIVMRYAGLATQLLVAIGLAVFFGLKADKWLHSAPLLACALPLITLSAIFYKLMKETGKTPEDEQK
jgi:F0F1-type ATP synthase assembly protein I